MLTIRLLGTPEFELNGEPLTGFNSNKTRALLCYLVVTGRVHTRPSLAGLFWGDLPEDKAQTNLRKSIANLRKQIQLYMLVTRQTVGFNKENCWIDVDDFALSHADHDTVQLAESANLYRGDFLEGLYINDAPAFEEWTLAQRARLREDALNILHRLVAHHAERNETSHAIRYARQLLTLEPWREETHRHLILLYARAGQRSSALAQYAQCQHDLLEELGVEPMDETQTLYNRIRYAPEPNNNLPVSATPFIGREMELAQLADRLIHPDCRLLTIVGPGGIGKTRMGLQVAQQLVNYFLEGVWYTELAGITTPDLIPVAIANALNLALPPAGDTQSHLLDHLRDKNLLLILDNFEHLADYNTLLANLLQNAPHLKILTTSRQQLHLQEEWVFELQGLTYPTQPDPDPQTYDAIQLFATTAQRHQRDFDPTAHLATIADICQLVEGYPLALELAAASTRTLSCRYIATAIRQSLSILQTPISNLPDRHRSMRAVFEHAWAQLSPSEQQTLAHIAIFHEGFTLPAALEVATANIANLSSLVNKSLLQRTPDGRFRLHNLLRQFLLKHYLTPGDHTNLSQKHVRYYTQLLHDSTASLRGGDQKQTLTALAQEWANLRSAWEWACTQADSQALETGFLGLFHFCDTRSRFQEGEQLFRTALRVPTLPDTLHAQIQARLGWFVFHLGRYDESYRLLSESLATLQYHHATPATIFNLNYLGALARHEGSYPSAKRYLQEARQLAQTYDDDFSLTIALNILGQVASLQGQYEQAKQLCQESLQLKRTLGDQWGMTFSLTYLGRVEQQLDNHASARALFEESMQISQALGDRRGIAFALQNLGDTALALGDHPRAQSAYQESWQIYQQIGSRRNADLVRQALTSLPT